MSYHLDTGERNKVASVVSLNVGLVAKAADWGADFWYWLWPVYVEHWATLKERVRPVCGLPSQVGAQILDLVLVRRSQLAALTRIHLVLQ